MDLKLEGRTALVTGASKGIGRAIATVLAEEGVDVHIASRSAETLEEARRDIAGRFQVKVTTHPLDLSRTENVLKLAEACGDVDILVNNAGAIPAATLDNIGPERWREAWDLKVFGYIDLTRAIYERMSARRAGVIVNILGVAGERLDAKYIAGSTGNAALYAFTRTLGGASPEVGVRVLGISPGRIATERMTTQLRRRAEMDFGDPERWEEYVKTFPFGRAGKPEEIAWLTAFLASDLAGYVSGTVITADGGAANRPPQA
jgi:NAD(P)-dependent dehydrogenase (short-subunit alcohol dehydrogenase family)